MVRLFLRRLSLLQHRQQLTVCSTIMTDDLPQARPNRHSLKHHLKSVSGDVNRAVHLNPKPLFRHCIHVLKTGFVCSMTLAILSGCFARAYILPVPSSILRHSTANVVNVKILRVVERCAFNNGYKPLSYERVSQQNGSNMLLAFYSKKFVEVFTRKEVFISVYVGGKSKIATVQISGENTSVAEIDRIKSYIYASLIDQVKDIRFRIEADSISG